MWPDHEDSKVIMAAESKYHALWLLLKTGSKNTLPGIVEASLSKSDKRRVRHWKIYSNGEGQQLGSVQAWMRQYSAHSIARFRHDTLALRCSTSDCPVLGLACQDCLSNHISNSALGQHFVYPLFIVLLELSSHILQQLYSQELLARQSLGSCFEIYRLECNCGIKSLPWKWVTNSVFGGNIIQLPLYCSESPSL